MTIEGEILDAGSWMPVGARSETRDWYERDSRFESRGASGTREKALKIEDFRFEILD
jgi:hypothetical protein